MTERVRQTIKNLTDLLSKEQTEILKIASLLMIPSLLTKITGQVYYVLTATQLGTQQPLRDFQLANTLPEMLANILLTGAISTLVIPFLIESKEREGEKRFLHLYNNFMNLAFLAFIIATGVLILFGDTLFPLLLDHVIRPAASDYPNPESLSNIISMMKFLMIPELILGISVFMSSGLNVYNRFFVPQLAPLFYNLGRIFGVFILLPLLDKSPWALVYGVLIGAVLHLAVQLPLVRMLNIKYEIVLDLKDKYVQKFLRISAPRVLAYAADTISFAMCQFIASGLGRAAISVFIYGNAIALVIPAIFGYPFSVASFPTLSAMYTRQDFEGMNKIIVQTLNQIFFLSIPFTLAIMILRLPLVRLVYGLLPNTEFRRDDTTMVAWTILFFSFGVIFTAAKWYMYRIFYVAKNTFIPLMIAIVSLITTYSLSILLSNLMSHSDSLNVSAIDFSLQNWFVRGDGAAAVGGVALAISIVSIYEFFLLLFLIRKYIVRVDFGHLFGELGRKLIPTTVAGTLMYFMYKTWDVLTFPIDAQPGFTGSTTLNLFILTTITVFTSFMVYYLLCFLFQVEDLRILRRFLNPIFRLGGFSIK
jgi:putative peptidoglycan lipid II flippase